MRADRQYKERSSRILLQSKSNSNSFIDKRPPYIDPLEIMNGSVKQLNKDYSRINQIRRCVSNYRSSQISQFKYSWSEEGADGVLIGEEDDKVKIGDKLKEFVIKFDGYDPLTIQLDHLASDVFQLHTTNAQIVKQGDALWEQIIKFALEDVSYRNKKGEIFFPNTALVMEKVKGKDLYSFFKEGGEEESLSSKRVTACIDMGKILVMDLVTRNYDRFDLAGIKEDLGSSPSDDEAYSPAHEEGERPWHAWDGNGQNMLIGTDGHVTPIDSQFSLTDNEPEYIRNVASLLTDRKERLLEAGKKILIESNCPEEYIEYFEQGVELGIDCLIAKKKSTLA